MSTGQAKVIIVAAVLMVALIFESLYPSGFLYPYFTQQKTTSSHRKRNVPPIAPPPPYTGLAPQKVALVMNRNATRDTYQRKLFFDGDNFFVALWNDTYSNGTLTSILYSSSADGITWIDPVALFTFSVAPYYGGNVDVCYPNRGSKDANNVDIDLAIYFTGSDGVTAQWRPYTISGQTLTLKTGRVATGLIGGQGGCVLSNLNGEQDFAIYHRTHVMETGIGLHGSSIYGTTDNDQSVPHGGTTTGGAQILPYKTSSPFNMLALAKGSNDKLYYNIAIETTRLFQNGFTEIATLGTGFSDFCACSEAQNLGDPEIIHLVYIKATGELCYNKFENDDFGLEKVLVVSGASYPVIASGNDGRLYVFYVKDEKIWLMLSDGSNWLGPYDFFTDKHTYNNPTYLSTNQNAQSGKIALVWTEDNEGSSEPYVVWFSYVTDL